MKIKICGITSEKEVAYLNDNKVDETTTFEEDVTLIAHWEEIPEYTKAKRKSIF